MNPYGSKKEMQISENPCISMTPSMKREKALQKIPDGKPIQESRSRNPEANLKPKPKVGFWVLGLGFGDFKPEPEHLKPPAASNPPSKEPLNRNPSSEGTPLSALSPKPYLPPTRSTFLGFLILASL